MPSPRTDAELRAALDGLAYHFVMLDEAAGQMDEIVELAGERPGLTASTSGTSLLVQSGTFEGWVSLTQFRAYVEWVLLLARKISDVVSDKPKLRERDVRVTDFGIESLPPLPGETRSRLDPMVAHLTYYQDANAGDWPIPAISDWARTTRTNLADRLRKKDDGDLGRYFLERLDHYKTEVSHYG